MSNYTTRVLRTTLGFSALLLFILANAASAAPDAGGDLYKAKCAVCHGADGKGATAVGKADNIRDLGSPEVQAQSDDLLSTIITSGKSKMPPYGKSLKPDQIAALVAYVRSLATK
jgi:mono/diheme cytochrome c family protein